MSPSARSHFELLDAATAAALVALIGAGTIPLSALAALTANRVAVIDGSGVLSANGALTSGALVRANGTGSLADSAGVVDADVSAAAAIAFSKMAGLTADRALISSGAGVVNTSALTAAQLAAAACAVTDTGRIDLTLSGNSLSADLVAGGVRTVDLGAQQAGYVDCGNQGTGSIASTSYADFAAHGYTPRRSSSRLLVVAIGAYGHTSGTTTITLRRGTTVISEENTYISSLAFNLAAVDTGHGGSSVTYNFSAKNTTPAGAIAYAKVLVFDMA